MINLFKVGAFFSCFMQAFTGPPNPFKKPVNKALTANKQVVYTTDLSKFKHNKF